MNNQLKESFRRYILFLGGIMATFLFTPRVYASNIFFESDSDSVKNVLFDKKVQSEESSGTFFENLISNDDDRKLYAPPPGESSNPQKIAPFGSSDLFFLLSIGTFFGLLGCIRRRRIGA